MRNGFVSGAEVVVGDDEVETEATRGFSLGEGAHAGVDGDDEAHSVGVSFLKHAGLQAVALVEAMRNMKSRFAAEHFDGGFEQHNSGGAVDVVVAVEKHRLMLRYGLLEAGYGCVHAEHQRGIVEMGELRIEEGEGFVGVRDPARDEKFRENLRQPRGFGQLG